MNNNLLDWIESNKLSVKEISDRTFEIEGVGTFFHLLPDERGKVIDRFNFRLNTEPSQEQDILKSDYIVFEFGNQFYYCKPKQDRTIKKDNTYEQLFVPEFNDFKYLGEISEEPLMDFCHLGIHSEYELLSGSGKCEDWVKKGAFMKMKALGICDKNTLAGVLSFQMACDKKKIKSIIGETVTVAYDYDEGSDTQSTLFLKLYVTNKKGWLNLLSINNAINTIYNGFIPEERLFEYLEGLIVVFPKESIYNFLRKEKKNQRIKIKQYSDRTKCYYQIDSVIFDSDDRDIKNLEDIKSFMSAKLVEPILINDSYYIDKSGFILREKFGKLGGSVVESSEDEYFKTVNDSFDNFSEWLDNEDLFETLQEAALNTNVLSDACSFKIETGLRKLPKYRFFEEYKNCDSVETLFFTLIQEGIDVKLVDIKNKQPYYDRIEKECALLLSADILDFFLILWDIIKWSKNNGIVVGAGRGSVGGSLVAYLLDITTVDPIKYDLLFERFLNEARLSGERAKSADSMPDIDTDFMGDRRADVRDYIRSRFGLNMVCSVGAYGRMKLRTCIKDFGRIIGLPFDKLNYVCKGIDEEHEYTFTDFVKYATKSTDLYNLFQEQPQIIELTQLALQQAKSASIHASAMVIVPDMDNDGDEADINSWMPTRRVDGNLVTEWEGKYVERAGFLKEDILGVKQLDKFQSIIAMIKKNRGIDIELEKIPMDAAPVYEFFCKGWNEDVFQFGTTGLKSYSRKVKPDDIEHLIAMSALFRPGPMDSNAHEDFANIKNKVKDSKGNRKEAVYDFGMQQVTEKTSGLYIYQEQIMQAMTVAGMSLVEADQARTYIKKFDMVEMSKFEERFVNGMVKKGCSKKEADFIWKKLVAFSGYGFNRSHSAAYSIMSYWSQWLKVYYPLEFWTTALQFAKDEDVINILSEIAMTNSDTRIMPPDVNESERVFVGSAREDKIYWAISKIKNIGDVAVDNILKVRETGGKFKSFEDFMGRVPKSKVNKKVVEHLILAGAFDQMEGVAEDNKTGRFAILKKFFDMRKESVPDSYLNRDANKSSFWSLIQKDLTGAGDVDYKSLLTKVVTSKSILSNYVTGAEFFEIKAKWNEVLMAGRLIHCEERKSKKEDARPYGRYRIETDNLLINATMWSDEYEEWGEKLNSLKGKMIGVTGTCKYDTYFGVNTLYLGSNKISFKLYEL